MGIKVLTTACMIAAVVIFVLAGALIIEHPSVKAPRSEKTLFAERLMWFSGAELLTLIGAGTGSLLIVRQARREYRDQALKNIRDLVEGSGEDQQNS